MDNLLLAAPTELGLQTLETQVITTLTAAGFTVSEHKVQRGPGVEYLGYKFGPEWCNLMALIFSHI